MVLREFSRWNNIKIKSIDKSENPDIDHLFFDINGLVSDKLHEIERDENKPIDKCDQNELINFIIDKIDIISHIFHPKITLGIFFDGVSPKAKINIQRQRRIREYNKYQNKWSFNFNSVSIGTEFMEVLSKKLEERIQDQKNNDEFWKNVNVIFSRPNEVGEAEHKIFSFMREKRYIENRANSFKRPQNEKTCIYTSDSDIYVLALAHHQSKIFIYNDYICKDSGIIKHLFSIDQLRNTILKLFKKSTKDEHNKIIDDIIVLTFLTENNYLPGINDVTLDDLIHIYRDHYDYKKNGFINNNRRSIDQKNLKKFLSIVNEKMDVINKMVYFLDKEMNENSNFENNDKSSNDPKEEHRPIKFTIMENYLIKRTIFSEVEQFSKNLELKSKYIECKNYEGIQFLKFLCSKFGLNLSEKHQIIIDTEIDKNWDFKLYCNNHHLDLNHLEDLNENQKTIFDKGCKEYDVKYKDSVRLRIEKRENNEKNGIKFLNQFKSEIKTLEKTKIFNDMKDDYYKNISKFSKFDKQNFINQYIEGLEWMIKSCYYKIPSWTWHFENRCWINKTNSYGPFISDLCEFEERDIEFEEGYPLTRLENLLMILPYESSDLLPESYKNFINSEEIKHFYGEINSFPDQKLMFKTLSSRPLFDIDKYKETIKDLNLTEEEKSRNTIKFPSYSNKIQFNMKRNGIKEKTNIHYENKENRPNKFTKNETKGNKYSGFTKNETRRNGSFGYKEKSCSYQKRNFTDDTKSRNKYENSKTFSSVKKTYYDENNNNSFIDSKLELYSCNKLIESDPSAENYIKRAKFYLKIHKYKDAMNDCKNALSEDPKCVEGNFIYYQCNLHRGHLKKAKEHLEKGLENSKKNKELSSYISKFENELNKIKEIEEAIKNVDDLIKEKKYSDALEILENTMLKCDKDIHPLPSSNDKVWKLDSENLNTIPIQWRLLRGELLIMNDEYHEAMKVAELILNSPGNSTNSEANTLKSKLLYITGRSNIDNTKKYLEKALSYYKKNEYAKELIEKIGEIDEKKKKINDKCFNNNKNEDVEVFEDAIKEYDKIFEDAIKEYDELIEECKKIYLTGTVEIIILRNKSSCLIKLKRYDECIESTTEGITILNKIIFQKGKPESINDYSNCKQNILFKELFKKRAYCLKEMGKFDEANKDYEILKILKPSNENEKKEFEELENHILSIKEKEIGNKFFNEKNYNEAINHYSKAIELYKEKSIYYSNRGIAYMKLFNYPLAINDFKESYKYDNKNYKAIINLSKCYRITLQFDKSEELKKFKLNQENKFYKYYIDESEKVTQIKAIYDIVSNKDSVDYSNILRYYDDNEKKYVEVEILKEKADKLSKKDIEKSLEYYNDALDKLNKLLNNLNHEYNSSKCNLPIYENLFKNKAECYKKLNKDSEAIEMYDLLVGLTNSEEYEKELFSLKKNSDIYQIIKKGKEAYKNKQYNESINLFNKIIEKYPNENPNCYLYRAKAYKKLLQYEEAINDLKIAIENEYNINDCYKKLFKCYLQLNQPENIKEINEKESSLIQNDEKLNKMLSRGKKLVKIKQNIEKYDKTSKYKEEIKEYENLMNKYKHYDISGFIEVLLNKEIAKLYLKLNNYDDCNKNITEAIEKLKSLVFEENNTDENSYKNSYFKNQFYELYKINADAKYHIEIEEKKEENCEIFGLDKEELNNQNLKMAYHKSIRKVYPKCNSIYEEEDSKKEYEESLKKINRCYSELRFSMR